MEKEKNNIKKRGLKKGQTNNPFGRPKGSKNTMSMSLKQKLRDLLIEDFDTFKKSLYDLHTKPAVYVKIYLELTKYIIPKPTEEEDRAERNMDTLMRRLFRADETEDEDN